MSDNILPSQNPNLSTSPEHTGPLPHHPSVDGKVSAAEAPPLPGETRLSPEEREWLRQQFPPIEEMESAVREVQEQGGFAFEDFFEELVESVRNGRDNA